MSPDRKRCRGEAATVAACKSRPSTRSVTLTIALLGTLLVALVTPAPAAAHGPVNPAATSYLATVRQAPAGIDAKVVDGDQRMWLQAGSGQTAVVLDYRGAPYLRFSPAGVQVNTNSSMYYLNQVPGRARAVQHRPADAAALVSGHERSCLPVARRALARAGGDGARAWDDVRRTVEHPVAGRWPPTS